LIPVKNTCELAISIGLPVFPCCADKKPATTHGFKDATDHPEGIRGLWECCPGPLIGVPTGPVSGIDVLDIDPRHGGGDWYAAKKENLPPTRIHRTRSGGLHLLFYHLDGLRNSSGKIAPGVDVRAEGGYIIWWPATGMDCKDYPPSGLPDWPPWLLSSLMSKPVQPPAIYPPHRGAETPLKLAGIVRMIAGAREGERNALTHWGACRIGEMVAAGEMASALGIEIIAEAAARAGLSRADALPTIHSGFRNGSGERCRRPDHRRPHASSRRQLDRSLPRPAGRHLRDSQSQGLIGVAARPSRAVGTLDLPSMAFTRAIDDDQDQL
jgi:hypothetical protein